MKKKSLPYLKNEKERKKREKQLFNLKKKTIKNCVKSRGKNQEIKINNNLLL